MQFKSMLLRVKEREKHAILYMFKKVEGEHFKKG